MPNSLLVELRTSLSETLRAMETASPEGVEAGRWYNAGYAEALRSVISRIDHLQRTHASTTHESALSE